MWRLSWQVGAWVCQESAAAALPLFVKEPRDAQSYGIKVGYGAGGQAGNTVRPGEAAPAKSSSCC